MKFRHSDSTFTIKHIVQVDEIHEFEYYYVLINQC